MHSLSTAPPHTAQWALFRACPGTSSQGASENELMCPQEKQTWCLPLFGLCIGLEKKWDFYVRKPSRRTPAVAGQTPRRQTINRQEGPTPGPGPCAAAPELTWAFLFFPTSSTLHQHTEAFQHPLRELKHHSHMAGPVLIPMGIGSTKRPEDGLKQGWSCRVRVHGSGDSGSIILCS